MAMSGIPGEETGGYLEGQMLIAMPGMGDPRFERTLLYLCAHSAEGAMGIVVNKLVASLSFADLLRQLEILPESAADAHLKPLRVHFGGPVETARGFVLHSSDYHSESSSMPVGDGISLTATTDILKAVAEGSGPHDVLLALGYAGWAPRQLENEIQSNGWLHCPADRELLFDADIDAKYTKALAKIGVDPSHLAGEAGHA